jgi:hypothetical protein
MIDANKRAHGLAILPHDLQADQLVIKELVGVLQAR